MNKYFFSHIFLSYYLSIYLSICLSISLSVRISVCLSVYLYVCLFFSLCFFFPSHLYFACISFFLFSSALYLRYFASLNLFIILCIEVDSARNAITGLQSVSTTHVRCLEEAMIHLSKLSYRADLGSDKRIKRSVVRLV